MIPGVIVSIRSNEHYRGAGDRKLRPRYKYRFCIVKRTKSTAFLRPCDEMSIRQYLTNEKLSKIKNEIPVYKADVTQLKIVSSNNLFYTNNSKIQYGNFLDNHRVPEPLYLYNDEQNHGVMRNWRRQTRLKII